MGREMVNFMYLGKVEKDFKETDRLLKLADKYDIRELHSVCSRRLIESISNENVFKLGLLGESYNAEDLVRHCAEYISKNRGEINIDDETTTNLLQRPSYTLKLLKIIVGGKNTFVLTNKEKLVEINRFRGQEKNGLYSGNRVDAIRFKSNKPVVLCGVGLYGAQNFLIPVSVELCDSTTSRLLQENFNLDTSYPFQKTIHMFSKPIKLDANLNYEVRAKYPTINHGWDVLDYGVDGQTSIGSDFMITFSQSTTSSDTNVQNGQIPSLYFVKEI